MKDKTKKWHAKNRQKDAGQNMESRNTTSRSDAIRDEKGSTMPRSINKNMSDDMNKNQGGKNSSR